MWEYYVITELRIIYKDSNSKVYDKTFVILKEIKHFVSYNGDLDNDKIINLYSCGEYIKPEYQRKYQKRVRDLLPPDVYIINISKMKSTEIKW
jgi:hypothetical protein